MPLPPGSSNHSRQSASATLCTLLICEVFLTAAFAGVVTGFVHSTRPAVPFVAIYSIGDLMLMAGFAFLWLVIGGALLSRVRVIRRWRKRTRAG